MTVPHLLLVLAINIVFGFNLVAAKFVMFELPPLAFAAGRFLLLLLVLLPVLRIVRGQMLQLVAIGLLMGTLHFALLSIGLQQADDVSSIAIVTQLVVPFSTIFSIVFLGEVVRWRRWFGMALAFAGVMVIGFDPRVFTYWQAVLYVVGAAVVAAGGMTMMKRVQGVNVFQLQAWLALIAFPTLAAMSWALERGQIGAVAGLSPLAAGGLVFSALGASLFGHGAMYYLLQRYELSLVTPLMLSSTLFGIAFGVLLLDDVLTARMTVGGAITLAGVLVITLRTGNRGPAATLDQPAVPQPRGGE